MGSVFRAFVALAFVALTALFAPAAHAAAADGSITSPTPGATAPVGEPVKLSASTSDVCDARLIVATPDGEKVPVATAGADPLCGVTSLGGAYTPQAAGTYTAILTSPKDGEISQVTFRATSPAPTATPTVTVTVTPAQSATPTATPTPTPTVTVTVTPTPKPTKTPTPKPTKTASSTARPKATPTKPVTPATVYVTPSAAAQGFVQPPAGPTPAALETDTPEFPPATPVVAAPAPAAQQPVLAYRVVSDGSDAGSPLLAVAATSGFFLGLIGLGGGYLLYRKSRETNAKA
ncbi:hypothetical protein [Streptosporangium sp. NPDC002524]|uniref:hypothetical protein n=1 Tax=Streptosporangium sp. NPDC002524 TaxID=3154537 RepID=UPI003332AB3A